MPSALRRQLPHLPGTPFRPSRLPATLALLALVATTTGCAFSPGTSFSRYDPNPNRLRMLLGDEPEEAPVPRGAITRITPDLIKAIRSTPQADPTASLQTVFGRAQPYRIGVGDVLAINVWGYPEFTPPATSNAPGAQGYSVSASGHIQFPFLGLVPAAGLTEAELHERLTQALARQLRNPQVTVKIQEFRAGRIFVDGEVRTPGQQAITDVPMTLPEALGRAGGLGPNADRSAVSLTRAGNTTRINLDQLTARGIDPHRILLAPGDVLRVGSRDDAKVYVLGEVNRPLAQPLRNGRLTLNEALGEAGGLYGATADPRQIYVIRAQQPDKPQIFHLDVSNPVALALAEGFELQARDVVYVDPVPLVRWNRVISLILPSAQAITVTRDAVLR